MAQKLIVHNSVSMDCAFTGFDLDLGRHYAIAGRLIPDVTLVGSTTAKTGVETYGAPEEKPEDMDRPDRDDHLPYCVIVDSTGRCKGLLHAFRSFEAYRDVIVLVCAQTPPDYLDYLHARNYRWHVCGDDRVDLKKALGVLEAEYDAGTIVTDTGASLVGALLDAGLVDEISLLIHPVIVGGKVQSLFGRAGAATGLRAVSSEVLEGGVVWARFASVPEA